MLQDLDTSTYVNNNVLIHIHIRIQYTKKRKLGYCSFFLPIAWTLILKLSAIHLYIFCYTVFLLSPFDSYSDNKNILVDRLKLFFDLDSALFLYFCLAKHLSTDSAICWQIRMLECIYHKVL